MKDSHPLCPMHRRIGDRARMRRSLPSRSRRLPASPTTSQSGHNQVQSGAQSGRSTPTPHQPRPRHPASRSHPRPGHLRRPRTPDLVGRRSPDARPGAARTGRPARPAPDNPTRAQTPGTATQWVHHARLALQFRRHMAQGRSLRVRRTLRLQHRRLRSGRLVPRARQHLVCINRERRAHRLLPGRLVVPLSGHGHRPGRSPAAGTTEPGRGRRDLAGPR